MAIFFLSVRKYKGPHGLPITATAGKDVPVAATPSLEEVVVVCEEEIMGATSDFSGDVALAFGTMVAMVGLTPEQKEIIARYYPELKFPSN